MLDTLLHNLDFDLERVADIIDPILTARQHCQASGLYIQGIVAHDRGFLSRNLSHPQTIQVTRCGTRWLVGHSPRCAISVAAAGMAEYHAALAFDPEHGFSLTSLTRECETWVNRQPLISARRHYLEDGDLIELGTFRFEFFLEQSAPLAEAEPISLSHIPVWRPS
ncbi:MAG: FHA domain-containing protein [Nodosilinea sp.]